MSAEKSFPDKIYAVVRRIPPGKVASYGFVGILAGRLDSARAVARAMAQVPPNHRLPCHRVLRSDGSLAPPHVFGKSQKRLLTQEGVLFKKNGRVDMNRCEWDGSRIRPGPQNP